MVNRWGFKRTFQNMARGFKQVYGVARQGVKHIPHALNKIDKYAETAMKVLVTAGQYAMQVLDAEENDYYKEQIKWEILKITVCVSQSLEM